MYEVYDNGISFLNFYGGDWFRKFVEYYYPDRTDYNFVFSSVNGKRTALSKYKGKKIKKESTLVNVFGKNYRRGYVYNGKYISSKLGKKKVNKILKYNKLQ